MPLTPEKDKDKKAKEVSETEALVKKAKLVKEAPTGEDWKEIVSGGRKYYVKKTKSETPPAETPVVPPKPKDTPPSKGKSTGLPQKPKKVIPPKPKDTPKEEDFTEEVVMLETPPPPKETGLFGDVRTYRKENVGASTKNYKVYNYPDESGNYTNKAISKSAVGDDVIDVAKSYDAKGNFKPFFTGEKLSKGEIQQVTIPDYGVTKKNTDYEGSLMMPGTKATRMVGGGGGEFNQRNTANTPNALESSPVGYIEQKYDTQGNPIVTPNVGVQMDTKNLKPLRKGEMEVGKMYDIPSEEPVLIPGKFAKGGSVKAPKMKKYFNGTEPDGTPSNPTKQNNTQGSIQPGTVQIGGGQGQYGVAGNATTATGATSAQTGDTKAPKTQEQINKETNIKNTIGGALGAYGKSYVASAPDTGSQDSTTKTAMGVVSDMGAIGGVVGGAYGIIDSVARPQKNIAEKIDVTYDASGKPVAKLRSEAKAKDTAILGSFLSPSEAITTRASYEGGWTDLSGKGYTKYLEKKAQEQLDPYIKANAEYKQQQAVANRNAGNLEGAQATDLYNLSSATFGDDKKINIQPAANGGVIGAAKMKYAKGGTIVGKGGPKDDAILTKSNEKGIAPGSFIVPAENNNKAKGIRAALFGDKNKKAEFKKEGGETKADVAVSNGEHLFTPKERKKIVNYLGEEILEELAPNAEENNEEMNMGGMLGTMNDRTNPKNKTTIPVGRLVRIDKDEDGKETRTEYPYSKKTKTVSALRKEVLEKRNDGSEVLKVQMPDGTWKVKMVKTFETIKKADGGLVEGEGDPLIPYSKSIVPLVNKTDSAAFQTGYMQANPRNTIVDKYGKVAYPSGLLRSGSEMMKEASENNKKFALEMNSPERAGMYAAYLANQEKYKKGVSAGMNLTNQDVIDIAKDKIEGYSFPIDRLSPADQKRIQKAIVDLGTSKKADGGKIMAPKMEKYKKGTPKKGTDQMERRDVALEELRKADEEQALKEQQAQEDVIMTTPVEEASYVMPKYTKAPRKGLGDYTKDFDPTSIAAMMQIAGGKKLLAKGSRPEDISKIDPTWNANVERAQREAAFGYTPEQAALLEQQRINALNDARFSGKNLAGGSASTAFQQERQAINQGWSNALQLKSSDQQLRMEKQQYADQAVRDRAAFLDSQRRRAFGDAMTTYDINQESGSALVGAGVRNAIGAYRYQKELDAQEKAAKVAGAPVYKV